MVEQFEADVEFDDDEVVGVHGLGLDSIIYAIQNGHLPGFNVDGGVLSEGRAGRLYFFPTIQSGLDHNLSQKQFNYSLKSARGYAEDSAQYQYLVQKYDLDPKSPADQAMARFVDIDAFDHDRHIVQAWAARGVSKEELIKSAREAEAYRGLVIGIRKSALEKFAAIDEKTNLPPKPGQFTDIGWYLDTQGRGLSVYDIKGVEPGGDKEYSYFSKLQDHLEHEQATEKR